MTLAPMRRDAVWLFLAMALLAATCIGCPPPSLQTEAGKRAYVAGQVLQRVGELQTAVIEAHAAELLSTETTGRVVTFTVDAAKTLKASPEGWQSTVGPAYIAMRNQLGAEDLARLAPYLSALDIILVQSGGVR